MSEPEMSEPEMSEPEMSEPEMSEPEMSEPEMSEPEMSEPEMSEARPQTENIAENAPDSVRALDPNVLQRRAADPQASIWVSASAGSGKTKVLTDRVLRLLLPQSEEIPGTPPHKILCLTFTKAGAGEMALRINKTLSRWAVMEEAALHNTLQDDLLGRTPMPYEIEAARRLFAQVVDTPGGLKIMTIHSFCQSVLSRFPLEAGISPGFQPLEESQELPLLLEARHKVFATNDTRIKEAIEHLARYNNEDQFAALLKQITSERYRLSKLLEGSFGLEGFYTSLCTSLNVQAGQTPDEIIEEGSQDSALNRPALQNAVEALISHGGNGDQKRAAQIAAYLENPADKRAEEFDAYYKIYNTDKDEPRKSLATKKVLELSPETGDILGREAERLLTLKEQRNAALCAALTRDLLFLGQEILQVYQDLKRQRGALDFDDMINHTVALLARESGAAWVLFKLDQGLDHILIDEAQDTNPEQWAIIDKLTDEFFSGTGARDDITRTVFTVGDDKQSIYSFQRASPQEFERMRGVFKKKIAQARRAYHPVDLNISFRSVKSVLTLVDAVFAKSGMAHESFRSRAKGHGGFAGLWPLFEEPESEPIDYWQPGIAVQDSISASSQCANFIAGQIKTWIEEGEVLESTGAPITPGDIMILMRTRTPFVAQLTRALKQRNIPVNGTDRMVLSMQLPVQDLTAMAAFALLPDDDLTLASILKSPLIGMSEEALYDLAVDRKVSLWQTLKNDAGNRETADYLKALIETARYAGPYDFFAGLLQRPGPGHEGSGLQAMIGRLGQDACDPLDEFLNAALQFEKSQTRSLQGFLQSFSQNRSEIKREMEEESQSVRIMTIHGAKGLQAPIVILPDTILNAGARRPDRLLWPQAPHDKQTEWSELLYAPRQDLSCAAYKALLAESKARADEEYERLLYVAMTRAEDRLYVTGYKGKTAPLPKSWYLSVQAGMESLKSESGFTMSEDGFMRFANPQLRAVEAPPETPAAGKAQNLEAPAWLYTPAPQEPDPPTPLIPSRPTEEEPAAASPLARDDEYRFRRGNITHKLLQFLPDIPLPSRESAAQSYIAKQGRDLSPEIQAGILKETSAILEHDEFAPLFGPGSMAEVPISGLLPDGRLISGQIDRLLITDQMVYIVDYKSNRPPPAQEQDIPAAYRKQMQAYYDVLKTIYPRREIKCALLWTDGPRLMEIDFAVED